jgi:hypothetical protein
LSAPAPPPCPAVTPAPSAALGSALEATAAAIFLGLTDPDRRHLLNRACRLAALVSGVLTGKSPAIEHELSIPAIDMTDIMRWID